ncbi:DUF5686 and carboxypeptidase-like regulatory domain-containing protein [soil metagenome]
MKHTNYIKASLVFLLTLFFVIGSFAQLTIVRGIVRDAATKLPLQNATVAFPAGRGSITDGMGRYLLQTQRNFTQIIVTYVGYKRDTINIKKDAEQEINIELEVDTTAALENVVIKKNRHKGYSNKNNPAVDLIRKVIDHKESNMPQAYDYTQFQQYDKLEFSLSNPSQSVTNNKLIKKYKFITDNRDSTKFEGHSLLPVYLEETISEKYFRKDPKASQTKIVATKKVNFGPFVDNKGITSYLNFIYSDIDIYEPNIVFLTSQLQSPISNLAPSFYIFTIQDTVVTEQGEKLVQLYFTPRNNGDVLFRGTMLITTDGNYAVQKVNMAISKNINVNWVRNIKVMQDFERSSDGRWHLSKSNLRTEFGLTQNKAASGIFGERLTSYRNYKIHEQQPDSVYVSKTNVDPRDEQPAKPDSFWTANRHDTLSTAEAKVYANIDSLQKMRSFKRLMDIGTILFAGYKAFNKIEIGPISTFYSFNPLEGFRLRFGGRTTAKFSNRIYLNGYGAYGFKDEKFKYYAGIGYSFNKKSIYEFPNNFIRASYQREVKIPGQELEFVAEDNFLLSFKRGDNDKFLYNKIFKLEYLKEYSNHFSFNAGFKNWEQSPALALKFLKYAPTDTQNIASVTTSELSLGLRFAPNEKFYQSRTYRTPLYNKYPVFTFRFIQGIKGFANGQYNYTNLSLNIFKKFYLGQFGYTHAVLDAGYIIGKVPYPLLTIHRANQTYAYQLQSYNLMNFLEFVSDHFVSLNLDHNFNGLLFNRIPIIRKWKWREELTFKILEGRVRNENNPAINPEVMQWPKKIITDADGNVTDIIPTTFSLNKKPYMEASVGIANIFRFVRIDLVKRLSYRSNPNVSSMGIRARIKFDF